MNTIEALTVVQFTNLLDEYFAPPKERHKMTAEEIKDVAQRLNKKIDVPLVRETKEEKILIKIVLKVDTFLYNNLPNELYDLVRDINNGISDDEAKTMIKRLTTLANDKIDIPWIPEFAERIAIRFVISIIINAARKKFDITQAADMLTDAKKDIPKVKNMSSKQVGDLLLS